MLTRLSVIYKTVKRKKEFIKIILFSNKKKKQKLLTIVFYSLVTDKHITTTMAKYILGFVMMSSLIAHSAQYGRKLFERQKTEIQNKFFFKLFFLSIQK